jgi:hypothetical protein
MNQTVKATVIGTIIIGLFMIVCTKIVTNSAWQMARAGKQYVEAQKVEAKQIVKAEQSKAKEVYLKGCTTKK